MRLYKIIIRSLVILFSLSAQAQESVGSSIVTRTKLQARGTKAIEQRVYDNGLGDIIQEIQTFSGTSFPDIVVKHEYDEYRRKTRTWLPVTTTSGGDFVSSHDIEILANTQYGDSAPFSRIEYDDFMQSEPAALFKAGSQWQSNDKKVTVAYIDTLIAGITFQGELFIDEDVQYLCKKSIDEDGCINMEYTDLNGRLMISQTSLGKTYYVYDLKGDLRYVFPPALSEHICNYNYSYTVDELMEDEMVNQYAYIYHYDYQHRCIYKKIPGCDPIFYVYDKAGNCILSQDGNQRQRGEWAYNIPDKFGRPCISGICYPDITYSKDPSRQPLRSEYIYAEYDGRNESTGGYSINNVSLSSQTLYSASYYDDYSFIGCHGIPSSLASYSVSGFSVDTSISHGLLTGTATAIIGEEGVAGYTYSAMYYDSRYNISQIVATNHLGNCEVTSTSYSYTGKPKNIDIQHNLRQYGSREKLSYTYDAADRLSKIGHKIDNSTDVILQQNTYNNLGQLSCMSNSNFTTWYTYDMHSWLKRISSKSQTVLMDEQLMYEDGTKPRYNGNISTMAWKAGNSIAQRYDFEYDNADRLTSATYKDASNRKKNYSTQYSYDCMGNIMSLKRLGLLDDGTYGMIDNLSLKYDGNQLTSVKDDGGYPTYSNAWNFPDEAEVAIEYEYDANGNVTKDLNRNILSIQYNSLNLPAKIEFEGNKTIKYTYSADGRKLRAEYTTALPATSKIIDYCGNMIFENGQIQQINVDGGYATYIGSSWAYHFYAKDHLGNNRVVVHPSGLNQQPQVNNYYPFGGLMASSTNQNQQRYKYNGKEFDRMHGLDWYDYGARWMDASIGRWHSIDPLCEKYYSTSPYVYCVNNPMNAIDPDGRDGVKVIDSQNKTITIKANFYVVTEGGNCPYTKEDIEQLNKETSNTFNKQVEGKTISKGKYKGYSLKFEINFIDGGTLKNAKSKAHKDIIFQYDEKGNKQCLHKGNTLSREDSKEHASFKPRDNGDVVGGETAFNRDVTMNSDFDSTQNRNHEFGHVLGLSHPKGKGTSGLMGYPPKDLNKSQRNKLANSRFLQTVVE